MIKLKTQILIREKRILDNFKEILMIKNHKINNKTKKKIIFNK